MTELNWQVLRGQLAEGLAKEQEWDQCLNFLKTSGLTVDEIYQAIRKVKPVVKEEFKDPRQMDIAELPGVQHFNGC